ncbi:MAG: glycosyltransferase family 4 protein [Desulfobacterales bacterium]|jgi:glycosyltransferase involved in cell wall biosynthesis
MKILFYAPFKPLDHAHPSGDLVTATEIVDYLINKGHQVVAASSLRCRWIYWKPWLWPRLIVEKRRVVRRFLKNDFDLWFTYHTYYKAPDMLGPYASSRLAIPYVIFQGIYSTKRRRNLKTLPGFYLNRHVLRAARHVFINKTVDWINLKRILPKERISYLSPGIYPDQFYFDPGARQALRTQWNIGDVPVVFSAAMFRADVKTEGLTWVIRACGELVRRGHHLHLVIAGDGKERHKLQRLAEAQLPERFHFAGEIPRTEMFRYYSASDVFVFPGIQESLGMVFLEAQSCGLPVVAFDNAGVPEAVQDGKTGFLVPMYAAEPFADAIERLLLDSKLRRTMGEAARSHIRWNYDLNKNYQKMEVVLQEVIKK